MTFSLAIRCEKTGHFGVAGTTSSMAMGARCLFVNHDAGAVITQHRTDPRLGPQALRLLRAGASAQEVIDSFETVAGIEWRELAVVDRMGNTAARQGKNQEPIYAKAFGKGMVAVGNILRNDSVAAAMIEAAEKAVDLPLAERLLAGLDAGLAAGGEVFALSSAALRISEHKDFCSVDLRIDKSAEPLTDLRALWQAYAPQQANFVERVLFPDLGGRATNSHDILASEKA